MESEVWIGENECQGRQVTSQVIACASEPTTDQTFGAYSPMAYGSLWREIPTFGV